MMYIALVFLVIFLSISSGSIFKFFGFISAKIGVPPLKTIELHKET